MVMKNLVLKQRTIQWWSLFFWVILMKNRSEHSVIYKLHMIVLLSKQILLTMMYLYGSTVEYLHTMVIIFYSNTYVRYVAIYYGTRSTIYLKTSSKPLSDCSWIESDALTRSTGIDKLQLPTYVRYDSKGMSFHFAER